MTPDIDLDALTAAIEAGSQALIAAANLTEGATDGDDICLKDEEACFRVNPVHFAWYQLGETGVVGETKAIARVAVEAAHKPLLSALTAARAELETAKREVFTLTNSEAAEIAFAERERDSAKAYMERVCVQRDNALSERDAARTEADHLRKVLDAANATTEAAQRIVTAALADGTATITAAAGAGDGEQDAATTERAA